MSKYVDRWAEPITMGEAYLAMIEFAWTFYRVGGETEKEIEFFAIHISGEPGSCFMDPALEKEWFEAVEKVRKQ